MTKGQQDNRKNYGLEESEVVHRSKIDKSPQNPADSNLQMNGFKDDFLNFDLLGDVKDT